MPSPCSCIGLLQEGHWWGVCCILPQTGQGRLRSIVMGLDRLMAAEHQLSSGALKPKFIQMESLPDPVDFIKAYTYWELAKEDSHC